MPPYLAAVSIEVRQAHKAGNALTCAGVGSGALRRPRGAAMLAHCWHIRVTPRTTPNHPALAPRMQDSQRWRNAVRVLADEAWSRSSRAAAPTSPSADRGPLLAHGWAYQGFRPLRCPSARCP